MYIFGGNKKVLKHTNEHKYRKNNKNDNNNLIIKSWQKALFVSSTFATIPDKPPQTILVVISAAFLALVVTIVCFFFVSPFSVMVISYD